MIVGLFLHSYPFAPGGDAAVRLEKFGERHHSVADVVTVLAVVCLALVTWSYLGDTARVPLWKPYASVALAVLLTLAALTRHPHWAISMRFLSGGWMIAAPYLLKFALWAYLAIGVLLATIASISGAYASRFDSPLPAVELS
jgi:hypothetical protein